MLSDYVVIDLEMTGLNPKTDRILEIGAVKVIGKQKVSTFSKLICPGRPLDETIVALTGITDERAKEGEELDASVAAFLEFVGGLPWVGHNVAFDYRYIRQWEVNHRIERECYAIDTLKIARKCLSGLEHRSLDSLCQHYKIERQACHRALEDAKATQALYEILEQNFLAGEPDLFEPKKLEYRVKHQTPATPKQIEFLSGLLQRYQVTPQIPLGQMSRSDASRLADQLIAKYGKAMP